MDKLQSTALVISIIGAFNWGVYGLSGFDVVAQLAGGSEQLFARSIYILISAAGILNIGILVRDGRSFKAPREPRPKVKVI